ncbi:hypothetical protein ACFO5O_11920 [Geojedonia litorea]|uniref:HEPN domain-containing protein n=1 Tax=Geojedonia litorea TaxID=1268269 RepID=A0ABV9N400_9FLAO
MSYLKAKSVFNLDAAEVLIEKHQCYAPSVHCSYFGCFQFIKSKLNEIGITYAKMEQDINLSKQNGGTPLTSHKYPISLMLKRIEEKTDVYYKRELQNKIKTLKVYREESDYFNEEVDYNKSNTALKLSREIIKSIKIKL